MKAEAYIRMAREKAADFGHPGSEAGVLAAWLELKDRIIEGLKDEIQSLVSQNSALRHVVARIEAEDL